jgi:peptidoglycan-N-acetylglucosamine deacetylase
VSAGLRERRGVQVANRPVTAWGRVWLVCEHSLIHCDFEPSHVRVGDSWTGIDYSQPADTWMEPLVHGRETELVENPANWYLDDLPPVMFVKASPNSHGFVNPRDIEQTWTDQLDWVHREQDYAPSR